MTVAAEVANDRMVDEMVRGGVVDRGSAIEAAFRRIRRDLFLPGEPLAAVYRADDAVLTHRGRRGEPTSSSSAPTMMAIMLRQLDVRPGQRVLEVGAGTGYNAGLLSALVGPAGQVVTIDLDTGIVAEARAHLAAAGITGVDVRAGDGWLGAPDAAPFDRIIATVGVADIAPAWIDQLAADGVLVAPVLVRRGERLSLAFTFEDGVLVGRDGVGCAFMSLRGPNAEDPAPPAHHDSWRTE